MRSILTVHHALSINLADPFINIFCIPAQTIRIDPIHTQEDDTTYPEVHPVSENGNTQNYQNPCPPEHDRSPFQPEVNPSSLKDKASAQPEMNAGPPEQDKATAQPELNTGPPEQDKLMFQPEVKPGFLEKLRFQRNQR